MKTKARFVLSKSKVIKQYKKIKENTDMVSYSYKTNQKVGNVLKKETECMFSVHSVESVNQLECPEKIWYFAQGWTKEELNKIFDKNVNKFVVDNETDLSVLLNYIKENNKKINLLLRMRLKEHTIHTGKHFVYGLYSNKINELLPKLRDNVLITKLGIHFHRKTQNVSEWSLIDELIDTIKHWDKIDFVNIGGGLPAEYKNFRPKVIKNIFFEISKIKEWLNNQGIQMIIEPGRYIAASSVKLETNIVNIYDNNIVVDCSIFNAAMDTWIANIRLLVENELEQGNAYTIKGCTPDSVDIIRYKVFLRDPKIGDKLVFLNAGAYNFNTNFCNLPKLETVIID